MDNNNTVEPHHWQVGDLLTVASRNELRLIVNVTETFIEVIAESGWYNRYPINSELPLYYKRSTNLAYTYTGREPLYQDFKNKLFAPYFNQQNHESTS